VSVKGWPHFFRAILERLVDNRDDVITQTLLDRSIKACLATRMLYAMLCQEHENKCGLSESAVTLDVVFLAYWMSGNPFFSYSALNPTHTIAKPTSLPTGPNSIKV
jgi:hypothetical protein